MLVVPMRMMVFIDQVEAGVREDEVSRVVDNSNCTKRLGHMKRFIMFTIMAGNRLVVYENTRNFS